MGKSVLLVLSFSLLTLGCKTNQACRPGSLFVRTVFDASTGTADRFEVTVRRDGVAPKTLPAFTRTPGARNESFELNFTTYRAGSSVTIDVAAKAQDELVAFGSQTITLLQGCTATNITLDLVAEVGDLAGVDLTGADLARRMVDLAEVPDDFAIAPDMAQQPTDMAVVVGAPGAPTNVVSMAKPGGKFTLTWTAPIDSGTSAITGYSIESTPAGLSEMSGAPPYTTVMALTTGTTYAFTVRAINGSGPGASAISNSVVAGDVPGAPPNVVATANGGKIDVTWGAAPGNSYALTGYSITTTPATTTRAAGAATTTVEIYPVMSGTPYTVSVTASNALGTSAAGTSNQVTPNCTPQSRTLYVSDNGTATVQHGANATGQANYVKPRKNTTIGSNLIGFLKFNLGTIAPWAKITSISLGLLCYDVFDDSLGAGHPNLAVWYSEDDNWDGSGVPTAAQTRLTTKLLDSIAGPTAPCGAFSIPGLIVSRHDFNVDVADRYITLGIEDIETAASKDTYAFFYGWNTTPPPNAKPSILVGFCE